MKVYLVKNLNVKTNKFGMTIYEYRSSDADYIFSNKKKAEWFFNKATENKNEWEEYKFNNIIRVKKEPFFEGNGIKMYDAYEICTKVIINY